MSRSKAAVKDDIRQLTGAERSAVLLLSLGEEHSSQLWKMMDEEEVKEVSQVMSNLGSVSASVVEKLMVEFVSQMSGTGSLMGSYESTERLISRFGLGSGSASGWSWCSDIDGLTLFDRCLARWPARRDPVVASPESFLKKHYRKS